jgi:hypothetical protein
MGISSAITEEQSCATIKESSNLYPPAPKMLDSDRASSGILVVEAKLKAALNSFDLIGVLLARDGNCTELRRAGTMRGKGLKKLVMFHDLVPGMYTIELLKGENVNGYMTAPVPRLPEYAVEIKAGELTYVGTLMARKKIGRKPPTIDLEYDRSREIEVWTRFRAYYGESSWSEAAAEHIESLQSEAR